MILLISAILRAHFSYSSQVFFVDLLLPCFLSCSVLSSTPYIGRFSEAGLLEWMRFVIFRARSRSALPGRFLRRRSRCVQQWKLNLESRSSTNANTVAEAKSYRGKGLEGGEKSVFASFFGWPEDREFVEKMRFGASYSTSNKLLLIARNIMTTGLQKCL